MEAVAKRHAGRVHADFKHVLASNSVKHVTSPTSWHALHVVFGLQDSVCFLDLDFLGLDKRIVEWDVVRDFSLRRRAVVPRTFASI